MALISCEECHKKISDKASSCPSCGAPQQANSSPISSPKTPPMTHHLKQRATERFRTETDELAIAAALGAKLKAIDSKFDESTMTKKASDLVMLKVNVMKEGDDCLITIDHNLRQKNIGGASEAILLLIFIFLVWWLLGGWAVIVLLLLYVFGKYSTEHSISFEKMNDCLSSLKKEFGK